MDQAEVKKFTAVSQNDLPAIRQFVEQTAVSLDGTPDAISELIVSTNEAITNILNHGYNHKAGDIEIMVARQNNHLIIRLRDHAHPFDPTSVPKPDITLPLEARTPGGLGVHMIREFTDDLTYRTTNDGENELIMIKYDAIIK
ncbi:MAG: ATP-binding protein [Chloroflexi bacterium]|nr:MAG: ATP-binding protein [Chloroflexota bacterium]